jgi:hypothetical protein
MGPEFVAPAAPYDGPAPPPFDPKSYPGSKTGDTDASATPAQKAFELVCLLREDSRVAVTDAAHLPCAAGALEHCASLHRDVLAAAARLLTLCHADPTTGPRRHLVAVANALLAHPIAVDQLLCFVACCPYVGRDAAAATWWVDHDADVDGGDDYFDGAEDAAASAKRCLVTPVQTSGDFYVAMARGPVGLLHELFTHAPHSVQETPGFSGFFRLWRPVSRSVWVRFGSFLDR